MFFLSLIPLEFTTSYLCLWTTHFRCSHWLFSYIWCHTWQVTSSSCCCPPAPRAWNTALLQSPATAATLVSARHLGVMQYLKLEGTRRIKTEIFSTKTTHFHLHNLKVCRKCSSSEHKVSERFATIGTWPSWIPLSKSTLC